MRKRQRGVSLVELLVAMTILLIGLVPMMRVFLYALQTGNRARKMTVATNLARDMAEEIRTKAFSNEYADYKNNSWQAVYPRDPDVAQTFGLETGEDADTTSSNGGRLKVFNDVDDYDGWCRGTDCGVTPVKPLETFDGQVYGKEGLVNLNGYTRRVRVRNLFPKFQNQTTYNPYYEVGEVDQETYMKSVIDFKRYNFENWSSCCRFDEDGNDVTGKSALKIIEVTVIYQGPDLADVRVKDLSFTTLPMDGPKGE